MDFEPISEWAYVVEIVGNGVICRPHRSYWSQDRQGMFSVQDVFVFSSMLDFIEWSKAVFQKRKPEFQPLVG